MKASLLLASALVLGAPAAFAAGAGQNATACCQAVNNNAVKPAAPVTAPSAAPAPSPRASGGPSTSSSLNDRPATAPTGVRNNNNYAEPRYDALNPFSAESQNAMWGAIEGRATGARPSPTPRGTGETNYSGPGVNQNHNAPLVDGGGKGQTGPAQNRF